MSVRRTSLPVLLTTAVVGLLGIAFQEEYWHWKIKLLDMGQRLLTVVSFVLPLGALSLSRYRQLT
jgi:hypothetical protein